MAPLPSRASLNSVAYGRPASCGRSRFYYRARLPGLQRRSWSVRNPAGVQALVAQTFVESLPAFGRDQHPARGQLRFTVRAYAVTCPQ